MKKIVLLFVCFLWANMLRTMAQVAINTDGTLADANAMLDVKSTAKGVKFPRMTTAQRIAIATTINDAGLMVFDIDKNSLYMFDGSRWMPFAYATSPFDQMKSKAPIGSAPYSRFGQSGDMDADYAIVAANNDSSANVYPGCAYVFKQTNGNWNQQARLTPSDGVTNDDFGESVAISGNYIVIGAAQKKIGNNTLQGAVYIYVRNGDTWTQQAKLVASDGAAGDYFGVAVDIEGATVIVGAFEASIGNKLHQGAVYVFTRSGTSWTQQNKILSDDGQSGDSFGVSLSIYHEYIAVGARRATTNVYEGGCAYVFAKNRNGGYFQQAKLLSSSPVEYGQFGHTIAIDSNNVIVGATKEIYSGMATGVVHSFTRTNGTWTSTGSYFPDRTEYVLGWGEHVALKGDIMMISAPDEDIAGVRDQGAYPFTKGMDLVLSLLLKK